MKLVHTCLSQKIHLECGPDQIILDQIWKNSDHFWKMFIFLIKSLNYFQGFKYLCVNIINVKNVAILNVQILNQWFEQGGNSHHQNATNVSNQNAIMIRKLLQKIIYVSYSKALILLNSKIKWLITGTKWWRSGAVFRYKSLKLQ